MDEDLNDVYEKIIDIDPESEQKSTQVLRHFIDLFLLGMLEEEPSLVLMSPRVEFLGSYFEGLKICTPNEFDINIVLTLPYDKDDITMTAKNRAGSITSISVPTDDTRGLVATWCNENGKISARRFRGWMINLGQRVLHSKKMMNVNGELYTITLKDTGVAMTAFLADKMDFSISVDVVIAFQFSLPKIPLGCKLNMKAVHETDVKTYFLVPISEYDWRSYEYKQTGVPPDVQQCIASRLCTHADSLRKRIDGVHHHIPER
ncbi:hypothetical protein EVAR_7290_1 [Eumeta japonica]|uniref:Mab-21-like nucleotidyltransferase domain-containing protein n=1 Tax=Eumeta variegata TaxID=151549 RepID=A0A4C1T5F9_EUMVA|nr:hypothetical protein EVAR_7290_1 [Eumeta japonica]